MQEYKIKEGHLNDIKTILNTLPYGDVHLVMLVLENLEKVEDEKPTTNDGVGGKELIEG